VIGLCGRTVANLPILGLSSVYASLVYINTRMSPVSGSSCVVKNWKAYLYCTETNFSNMSTGTCSVHVCMLKLRMENYCCTCTHACINFYFGFELRFRYIYTVSFFLTNLRNVTALLIHTVVNLYLTQIGYGALNILLQGEYLRLSLYCEFKKEKCCYEAEI
jgi:hypothetical protein